MILRLPIEEQHYLSVERVLPEQPRTHTHLRTLW